MLNRLKALCIAAAVVALAKSAVASSLIYQRTLRSTTWVIAKTDTPGRVSTGTGVLVDRDRRLMVTNQHVVGDQKDVVVFFAQMKNGRPITDRGDYVKQVSRIGIRGKVLVAEAKRDLAVIQLADLPDDAVALPLAYTGVGPGDDVHAVGNPGASGALWVYSSGTVRSVYRKQFRTEKAIHDMTVVETQTPMNHGDSGGPVVNDAGELVAISQSMGVKGNLVNWCVDVSEVKSLVADVRNGLPTNLARKPADAGAMLKQAGLTYTTTTGAAGTLTIDKPIDAPAPPAVYVAVDVETYGNAKTRRVWSVAVSSSKPLTGEQALMLLAQNGRTKLGGWVVTKDAAGRTLVLFVARLDATGDAAAFRSAVQYVARVADSMKKQLAGNTQVAAAP